MRATLIFGLLAAVICSCNRSYVQMDKNGMRHQYIALRVMYDKPASYHFINDWWIIDNWGLKRDELVRNDGPDYFGTLYVDFVNDGNRWPAKMYFTDLELRHVQNNGRMWVTTRELPRHLAQTNIEVFLRNYAQALSGTDYRPRRGPLEIVSHTSRAYATKILDEQKTQFGPWEAVIGTIEVANLEQLRFDPNHRLELIRVIFARFDLTKPMFLKKANLLPRSGKGLLMVAYSNAPDFFEQSLGDFSTFLEQFEVKGQRVKMQPPALQQPAPPPAPAPVEEPPASEGKPEPELKSEPVLDPTPEASTNNKK